MTVKAINWIIIIAVSVAITVYIAMGVFGIGVNAAKNSPVQISSATIQPISVDTTGHVATLNMTVTIKNLGATTNITAYNATVTLNGHTYVLYPVKYISKIHGASTGKVDPTKGIPVAPGDSVTIIYTITSTQGYWLYGNITTGNVVKVPFVIQTDSKPLPGNAIWVNQLGS